MKDIADPTSLAVVPAESTRCCGGRGWMAGMLGVTLAAVGTAVYFAGVASEARHGSALQAAIADQLSGQSGVSGELANWENLPVANATAAVSSEKFSLATGPVSDQADGLFVLDHNSGLLQCSVMYPRAGRFMATFTVNVADSLGTDGKGGSYIMATGVADFPRSSSNPVGRSVIYILDTSSGNYACYGVPFNAQAMNANRPQQGLLVLIGQGTANPIVDRDNLR
ncbi:hypothetical protein LOC71_15880 [Rhodopirellula sp. JC740]|uniref:Uncharacterized protein n=1 Tax=Rhodopirellula halodulae TaxID=2894198 RepID=A0ABS8NMS6_9BACT|nr:hypothetical protein [Rhodopirellula sp. JC740]MCC9643766.1 hypothetical protein [Rhodopirellula sp. JC740]